MPCERSSRSSTASATAGSVKLGQPVPLSNLASVRRRVPSHASVPRHEPRARRSPTPRRPDRSRYREFESRTTPASRAGSRAANEPNPTVPPLCQTNVGSPRRTWSQARPTATFPPLNVRCGPRASRRASARGVRSGLRWARRYVSMSTAVDRRTPAPASAGMRNGGAGGAARGSPAGTATTAPRRFRKDCRMRIRPERGSPEVCVARSSRVTSAGRSKGTWPATGSSSPTSPRSDISASSSPVNVLVIEPISISESGPRGRAVPEDPNAFTASSSPRIRPATTPTARPRSIHDPSARSTSRCASARATAPLIRDRGPEEVVHNFDDDWRPAPRVASYDGYKATRAVDPEGLPEQFEVLLDLLPATGMTMASAQGWEAEDAIGTLCASAGRRDRIDIVTGDRDLIQLVRDPGVGVLFTRRGVSELDVLDEPGVEAKYGVPAGRYADFAILRGDPSDELPGVRGVGEKTARALILAYPSLEAVEEDARAERAKAGPLRGSAALKARIREAADYLVAMRDVVPIRTDLEVELERGRRDDRRLDELAERWGLTGPVRRLRAALDG